MTACGSNDDDDYDSFLQKKNKFLNTTDLSQQLYNGYELGDELPVPCPSKAHKGDKNIFLNCFLCKRRMSSGKWKKNTEPIVINPVDAAFRSKPNTRQNEHMNFLGDYATLNEKHWGFQTNFNTNIEADLLSLQKYVVSVNANQMNTNIILADEIQLLKQQFLEMKPMLRNANLPNDPIQANLLVNNPILVNDHTQTKRNLITPQKKPEDKQKNRLIYAPDDYDFQREKKKPTKRKKRAPDV